MDNFKKENNKNQKNMAQNVAYSDKSKVCSDKNKKTCVDNNKANKSKFEHKSGHKDSEVGGKRVHSEKKHSAAPEKKYTKHTNY